MVVLDFSIVNVALPTLSAELGVSADAAQWVVTAYALTFGGLLVLGGRAADLFGRRRTLTVGLVSFAVASAAGGLAGDMTLLVASRAVQGIAAALIAPASLSILTTSFREGPARNRVLGLYGITASVGFVVGLVAGGVLVDTVGWRGVFFVNVPVCFAIAAVGRRVLPPMRATEGSRRLDLLGALMVTAAAALLVLAPSIGASDGWLSAAFVGCLIGSVVCLVAFARHEQRSRNPLVPLGLFRHRALVGGDIVAGLVGAWLAAEVLVVSVYSQDVLGYSALAAGLVAIPQGVGGILRGVVGPTLLDRVGIRRFLVGNCLLAAAGLGVLFRFPVTSEYPLLALVFIAIGFGTTNVMFGATVMGSSGVRNDEQGLAGAVLNASRQIGSAIGVAVLLSVAASTTARSGAGTAGGYRTGLLWATTIAVAAALISLLVKPSRGAELARNRRSQLGSKGWPASTGSFTSREVPCPVRLSSCSVPPLASTRSLRPTSPEPRTGSAPPTPSSLMNSRTSPSSVSTRTSTTEALACLATLVSASDTT